MSARSRLPRKSYINNSTVNTCAYAVCLSYSPLFSRSLSPSLMFYTSQTHVHTFSRSLSHCFHTPGLLESHSVPLAGESAGLMGCCLIACFLCVAWTLTVLLSYREVCFCRSWQHAAALTCVCVCVCYALSEKATGV